MDRVVCLARGALHRKLRRQLDGKEYGHSGGTVPLA